MLRKYELLGTTKKKFSWWILSTLCLCPARGVYMPLSGLITKNLLDKVSIYVYFLETLFLCHLP